jgi:predicted Zn-dependent protease
MAINPYASCPCGSGKQFKWCCQPYYGYVEKALTQHEKGQRAASEQTLAQLVAQFPKVPQAWGYQAQVLFLNDKREEADAALQKAFDLDANFAYGFWLRGLMRLEEGETLGALLLFRKTAELLDPHAKEVQAQVHSRIAELELQANRPVAARAALDRARHFAPQAQELNQAFESVFGPEARLPESARKAYAFRPSRAGKADRWGPALESANSGKLTDALKALEGIVEADESDPSAWFNLGLTRAWLGDNARALDALARSIDLETDEKRLEENGALTEVLRCGHGLERETDYIEHRAYMQIRDAEAVGKALNEWGKAGRLVVVNADREHGIFSALLLEETPDLGVGVGTPVARLQSYFVIDGDIVRLWHSNRAMLDEALQEVRTKAGAGLSDPQFDTGAAQFGDVVAEIMLFPTREGADPEQVEQKMRDRAREFFEETWLRRPLKSLGGATPLDAAGHPGAKKRLPGVIRFMEECLGGAGPRADGQPARPMYDFDRLRRKLGLTAAPAAAGGEIDFESQSAATLGGLKPEALSDAQIGQAFRAAIKLDAPDLAAGFARHAATRGSIGDRWPFFNHLIRSAREEGRADEVLRLLDEGEKADAATNAGVRAIDYALGRGQALARSGKPDEAYAVFREAITRSPNELKLYAPAAEAMLGRKQGSRALEFAEQGLKVARAQNNRDAEQQFLELVGAARKLG